MTLSELAKAIDGGEPMDAERVPALAKLAHVALVCGVRPELSDLSDATERAAWYMAGQELATVRASQIGMATQGPIGLAVNEAEIDGGAAYLATIVEATAAELASVRRYALSKPPAMQITTGA